MRTVKIAIQNAREQPCYLRLKRWAVCKSIWGGYSIVHLKTGRSLYDNLKRLSDARLVARKCESFSPDSMERLSFADDLAKIPEADQVSFKRKVLAIKRSSK